MKEVKKIKGAYVRNLCIRLDVRNWKILSGLPIFGRISIKDVKLFCNDIWLIYKHIHCVIMFTKLQQKIKCQLQNHLLYWMFITIHFLYAHLKRSILRQVGPRGSLQYIIKLYVKICIFVFIFGLRSGPSTLITLCIWAYIMW